MVNYCHSSTTAVVTVVPPQLSQLHQSYGKTVTTAVEQV